MHATPAAPAPTTTTVTSSGRLLTSRSAFRSAASTTIAVPCWSSWKTGMSSSARSRRSISKQRGAEMSSRLMPPKVGAAAFTNAMISSTSFVSTQSGNASTSANSLKSSALPSITGIAASGPMSPSPSTAVPSDTTATVLPLMVSAHALVRSPLIAIETRATPGVYAIERSSRVLSGSLPTTSILPPLCMRKVRSETLSTCTPSRSRTARTTASAWSPSPHATVTSRTTWLDSTRTRSIAPSIASVSAIVCATPANVAPCCGMRSRIVKL